jgi:hypothetical protein
MKRRDTDTGHFEVLRVLDQFARTRGGVLSDDRVSDDFIAQMSAALKAHRTNPMRVHGLRVQSMFAHVASALGKCRAITEEDSGTLFTADESSRRPDYRIVTDTGNQFLVEVKNCHDREFGDYRLKSDYLESLRNYAQCMNVPLKIAIYWSRWNQWVLVDARNFHLEGSFWVVSMLGAMQSNEMYKLGDVLLATVPPLVIRIYADQQKPCEVRADGTAPFTIAKVEFLCNGEVISDPYERDQQMRRAYTSPAA